MTVGDNLLRHEMVGAIFIILAGSALHFVFGWSGGWRPVALIAAVNESIWEHLKLAFWPGLFWAFIPVVGSDPTLARRLATKGMSLLLTALLIVTVFEGYTRVLDHHFLALDIGLFVVAVLAGQGLSVWLLSRPAPRGVLTVGWALLVTQLAAYSLFTYWPPDNWLFIDGRTGLAGIPLF